MFKNFKITCDEATTICDKSQYKEASFLDRQYTVFGKVIEGMELVDKIKKGNSDNNGSVSDPDKIISFK